MHTRPDTTAFQHLIRRQASGTSANDVRTISCLHSNPSINYTEFSLSNLTTNEVVGVNPTESFLSGDACLESTQWWTSDQQERCSKGQNVPLTSRDPVLRRPKSSLPTHKTRVQSRSSFSQLTLKNQEHAEVRLVEQILTVSAGAAWHSSAAEASSSTRSMISTAPVGLADATSSRGSPTVRRLL